jgi:hypothetical protein
MDHLEVVRGLKRAMAVGGEAKAAGQAAIARQEYGLAIEAFRRALCICGYEQYRDDPTPECE